MKKDDPASVIQEAMSESDKVEKMGIGLTFLKPDKDSGGLPVKRIKDDGAAASSTITPGDIVMSIDGANM